MKTNSAKARISQTTHEVKEVLELGEQVVYQARGYVVAKNVTDNQDGTQNVTSIIKTDFIDLQLVGETNQPLKTDLVVGKSKSQALRQKCFVIAKELGESEEGLYNAVIQKANDYLDAYRDAKIGT